MNENRIGTYSFIAEPFHVDFTGRLTLGVLGNHLLNCAGFHASERGFGMATVNEENYTWVLSRLAIEMKEMPRQYESFSIDTWVEDVYRLFTNRNYAIRDKDGHSIGYARSVWAMINMHTRRPIDLLSINGGSIREFICDAPCPIDTPSRIKVNAGNETASLRAKYSDIDVNGHVNSIRYIEHILDLFPLQLYREKKATTTTCSLSTWTERGKMIPTRPPSARTAEKRCAERKLFLKKAKRNRKGYRISK